MCCQHDNGMGGDGTGLGRRGGVFGGRRDGFQTGLQTTSKGVLTFADAEIRRWTSQWCRLAAEGKEPWWR